MWDRRTIKAYAKQELRQSYWLSFGVCLVAGILGAGGSGASYNFGGSSNSSNSSYDGPFFSTFDFSDSMLAALVAVIVGVAVIGLFIGIAVSIFWANPIEVGKCSFFIRAPYGDRQFTNLFSSLKSGRYMSIVKTMFFTNLYIFLWSLLLWVPGIVKWFQYRMVRYIIADDPSLSPDQAMELSRRMTDGEKLNMFVLFLSFIGWGLLCTLTLGIGFLFLAPYWEATWAQLYFLLRTKVTSPPQYGQYPPDQYGQIPPDPYDQVPPGM